MRYATNDGNQVGSLRLDIAKLGKSIGRHAREKAEEKRKFIRELPLRIRFNKGVKAMSWYVSSNAMDRMIDRYNQYLANGGSETDAIEAVMLWAAEKQYVYDKAKIAKATKKVLACNPWFKTTVLIFEKDHPALAIILLIIPIYVIIFGGAGLLINVRTNAFTTIVAVVGLAAAYWYFVFEYLLKKPE